MNNPAFRKKGKTVRKVGRNIPHFNFELTNRQFVVAVADIIYEYSDYFTINSDGSKELDMSKVADKTKVLAFLNLYDLAKKASDKEFQQAYVKLIKEMAV